MLDDMERKEKAQNRGGIQRLKKHLVEFIRN